MKTLRIIFLLVILFSCTKENSNYKSVGTITGIDGTMCGCCGGWIINIEDVRYLIVSMPKDSDLDLSKETYPITVRLDWQLVSNGCKQFNNIDVQRILKL